MAYWPFLSLARGKSYYRLCRLTRKFRRTKTNRNLRLYPIVSPVPLVPPEPTSTQKLPHAIRKKMAYWPFLSLARGKSYSSFSKLSRKFRRPKTNLNLRLYPIVSPVPRIPSEPTSTRKFPHAIRKKMVY